MVCLEMNQKLKISRQNFAWKLKIHFLEMEEEELLSPDEIRKIENELELKLANMTLEDLEESSGSVLDVLQCL